MPRKKPNRRKSADQKTTKRKLSRREVLTAGALFAGGAVLLGGAATTTALAFVRSLDEADLAVVGNGVPVIVQIHDPQCALCARLQKQTRNALKGLSDDDVLFRIANITSQDGAAFQMQQNLPHVTLALFDGSGQRVHVVRGVHPADDLKHIFKDQLGLRVN